MLILHSVLKRLLVVNVSQPNDPVHMNSFLHRNQCRNSGECEQINDEKHNREFEHPDYCSDGGKCQNQQEDHLRQYRHLPFCKKSHRCMDFQKQVPEHCRKYRHCAPRCPHRNHCVMFHDKAHLDEFQHPFTTPCQQTPFDCSHHSRFSRIKKYWWSAQLRFNNIVLISLMYAYGVETVLIRRHYIGPNRSILLVIYVLMMADVINSMMKII